MKYFFDNCISHRYAKMLAALDVQVVALQDLFAENIPDGEMFPKLKDQGLVFVTADDRQKTREREARAMREAGLTALWFGPFWHRMLFWDQAKWLVAKWPIIDGYVRGVAVGTCAEVNQNGTSRPFTLKSR